MGASDVGLYLTERVEGQIKYHGRKAVQHRRRFRRLAALSIGATALTPVLLVLDIIFSPPPLDHPSEVIFRILPAAVAMVAAIATVSLSAFKNKESWITHRLTCEALQREVHLFRYSAGPYAGIADPAALFVERAETLMESESREWKQVAESSGGLRSDAAA